MSDDASDKTAVDDEDIAIVGMAAHMPGAASVEAFWHNLRDGICAIRRLGRSELLEAGEAKHLIDRPDYVPFAAPLDGFADFDAGFFGLSPKEAAIMDPQHRQMLEVAWEAMENAGHPPGAETAQVGVFTGCGMGSYFYFNVCSNTDLVDETGMFLLRHTGNDKDFLATRISHVFDLKGPSVNLQTACSTSLVATHYAVQALLTGECDMAIAGGVTIEMPQGRGYLYKSGEVLSPDGQCHAFDHRAQGTVFGSGAGAVVLRRLADARRDGDHVWAVIKGTAVNNDGAAKAGYLAPSVEGQADAVAEAQAMAGVPADSVDYVECHGTGTYLGDPIEVAALTDAFRRSTEATDFCRIGSVKTNIGHLDTAAGVAGLIKTALALHHRQIPPSLGYEAANPAIAFDGSPFRVADRLLDWPDPGRPRRAGVNALGVGGTNAHIVLEEAPARPESEPSDWPFQLLVVSGRNTAALADNAKALAAHLRAHPEQPLADIAWTLKQGRRAFEKRRVVVAETHAQAATLLEQNDPRRVFTHSRLPDRPETVFMFPGGGAQYAGMARDLYETEPVFAEWMDRGLDVLQERVDYDLRAVWLAGPEQQEWAEARLRRPSVQLPLIMIVEYALARMWIGWGVRPDAMIGHSMGENTAACLAGVIGFEDCIGLVHLRGQLFDALPVGGMLSVALAADKLRPLLGEDLDLAAINAPGMSVVSGPDAALEALAADLAARDIDCRRIPIDVAAHSRMLEPILGRFRDYLRSIPLSPPEIPFISNRTGGFITEAQATDPEYWVDHLRHTVRFADGLSTLSSEPSRIYLEVGPGRALSSFVGQHDRLSADQAIATLRHPEDEGADDEFFLAALGRVWALGGDFDWGQYWGEARRNRVPLPGYAFQRTPHFIAPAQVQPRHDSPVPARIEDLSDWGWRPAWTPRYAECEIDVDGDLSDSPPERWLIFADDAGLADRLVPRLRSAGHAVSIVRPGDGFARLGEDDYMIAPETGREDYEALLDDLAARDRLPTRAAHLWLVTADESFRPGSSFFHRVQEQGFWSLFHFAQAWSGADRGDLHLGIVTTDAMQVRQEPLRHPEKATIMGPARVMPHEMPGLTCALLDLDPALAPRAQAAQVLEDLLARPGNPVAALRGGRRLEQAFRPMPLVPPQAPAIAEGATVLITGGFGGIGLTLAEAMIRRHKARIVLVSRHALPPREQWVALLRNSAPRDRIARRIRAVQRLEQAGGEVMTLAADVANIEEMRGVLSATEARFGPVSGVVHAAGVIDDAPIPAKTPIQIEEVLAPKAHGAQVLDSLFPDGALDWMVLFSSTSTITAPAGQVDYVAANEYLNAFAKSRQGGRTRVTAINWGVWSDVGMAAEAMAEDTPPPEPDPIEAPLLDAAGFDADGHRVFTARWRTQERWILDDHRLVGGDALMPGAAMPELLAEALSLQDEDGGFEIRDLQFLRPLRVDDDAASEIRLTLARGAEGYDIALDSAPQDAGFTRHVEASVRPGPLPAPDKLDLAAIAARLPAPVVAAPDGTLTTPQQAHLAFGPRWLALSETRTGQNEGLARLRLPPGCDGYALPPGVMDMATGWAMALIDGYDPACLWVPAACDLLRVHRPLPAEVFSWVRNAADNRADQGRAAFDITIAAPDGTVLVEVLGFTIHRIDGTLHFAPPQPAAPDPAPREPSPAEARLRRMIAEGIPPDQGAEAFFRALGHGGPQIVVSSIDLDTLGHEAAQVLQPTDTGGQEFERPAMDNAFVAPETEVECKLAEFWGELLGVGDIGAEDSFFDLGGHSLIAVRMFALVRKTWNVDFPMSVLFEAPTIRKCAALIEKHHAAGAGGPLSHDATATETGRDFTHLVAIHQGDGGPKTPFFMIAGMFGNVLNLRHLGQLLGVERPFYGLRARGLYGDEAPYRTIPEAAASYIAEMRQVQPEGPYMVGGFSGGGIAAFEVAQQLHAAGQDVAAVVLLDTPLPVGTPLSLRDRAVIQWQELRAGGVGYPARWLRNRLRWEIEKRRKRSDPEGTAPTFHNVAVGDAFLEAISAYRLRGWEGPLTLFRPPLSGKWQVAADRWVSDNRAYVLADNGWSGLAPRLEVVEVPGDHDSIVLEPNVRVLAARMKRLLDAAERGRAAAAPLSRREAAE